MSNSHSRNRTCDFLAVRYKCFHQVLCVIVLLESSRRLANGESARFRAFAKILVRKTQEDDLLTNHLQMHLQITWSVLQKSFLSFIKGFQCMEGITWGGDSLHISKKLCCLGHRLSKSKEFRSFFLF